MDKKPGSETVDVDAAAPAPEATAPVTATAEANEPPAAIGDAEAGAPAETSETTETAVEVASAAPAETSAVEPSAETPVVETAPVEAAGFAAAPAAEEAPAESTIDPLAAQQEVDARAAAAREADETKPDFSNSPYKFNPISVDYKPFDLKVAAKPTEALNSAAAAPAAPLASMPAASTDPSAAAAPGPKVSEADNQACLARLAEVLGLVKIEKTPLLRNLSLAQNASVPLPAGKDAVLIQTTSNLAIAAKGMVEFQDKGHIKAADALEGAVIALNDKASYPNGVELKGDMRDRFMLMLAAKKVGLQVANPVKDEDLSAEVRNALTTEFVLHLMTLKDTVDSDATAPAGGDSGPLGAGDVRRANELLSGSKPAEPSIGSRVNVSERDSRGRAEPTLAMA